MFVVAAALIDPSGRILLQKRRQGRAMAGLWEFPGGKVEPFETPEAALVRELQEELGIQVDPGALVPACFASAPLGEAHLILLLYHCRHWSGTPEPLDAADLKWSLPVEMKAEEMPPADQPLIDLLERLI